MPDAMKPTKLYPRPTRDGLWHPVDAKGRAGWPVHVDILRDGEGKRHVSIGNFNTEETSGLDSYPKRTRWLRYRDPKVTL